MCKQLGILVMIILLLPGCMPPTETTSVTVPTATLVPPSSATPDAVLLRVQGEVRLQQVITGQVVPASFGDGLWRGDVITTGQDAQAEVLCSDGDSVRIEPNQSVAVVCGETPDPVYQSVIVRIHGGQIETLPPTRPDLPDDDDNLPTILSPRNTHLIEGRPAIRWRAVEGAGDYTVLVSDPRGELWQVTTQETELPYPEPQPALEAGVSYLIQITAGMGPTQSQPSETVLLMMLSAADVEQVRQFETQVEALDVSAESARFILAVYYADQELYDAAITELVSLAEGTRSPLVHRLLGDAYLAVQLDAEATQSYEEAHKLVQAQDNRLVQAEAEVGLGHVESVARRFEEALKHYQAALALYQELGLQNDAEAVAKLVADTETRLPTPKP